MGVPSLFIYLYNKYKQVTFLFLKESSKIKSKGRINLYFDFNSLIHPIVYKVLDKYVINQIKPSNAELYNEIFIEIQRYTDHIIDQVDNSTLNTIYIITDGVAPRAKMNQQRIRRFLSILNNSPERRELFDTNCISPGTLFMKELDCFLRNWYANKSNVVFSDSNDPGEAEHKIMKIIKGTEDRTVTHVIYGLDADLIMLSLACNKNIKLLRENTLHHKWCQDSKFLLYHISGLKKEILNDIYDGTGLQINYNTIKDFIYLNFFIGNDFIPGIKNFEITSNGIDYIISIYTELLKKYEGNFYIIDKYSNINNNNLIEFLEDLNEILKMEAEEQIDVKNERGAKKCLSYLKTSLWIHKYYNFGCPSFSWFYNYYYPPTLDEIIEYLKTFRVSSKFNDDLPLNPDIQLLCILPKESSEIIQNKEHCKVFGLLPEFYPDPKTIEIDMNNQDKEWKAIVKMPFINIDKILEIINI